MESLFREERNWKRTRGQWPYRPAATRAMRNRHVMLYDLNYLNIYHSKWPLRLITPGIHVHIASNRHFGGSEAMTASKWHQRSYDLRFDISNLYYPSIYVHVASNSHFGGVWGHGGLQMTSEVTSDLGNELSDLNYLCTHGFVASISSNSMKFTEKEAKYDPLTCVASPQVKTAEYHFLCPWTIMSVSTVS